MDFFLTVCVGFAQLLLGFMGIYVSLRPPQQKHHWYWIGAFMAMGLLGIAFTGWMAKRASNAQEAANNEISIAVSAATSANTAATNANNAAVAAEKETESASSEARKANEELSMQINQRSKETNAAILKVGTDTETSIKAISAGPVPRRISPENRTKLIAFLAMKPATVSISAIANDAEAYRFAEDWFEIFKGAKWKIEGDTINAFISAGPPQFGVVIALHGTPVGANEVFQVQNTEPAGFIGQAMEALKMVVTGQRYPDIPEDTVRLSFYARPPN